MTDKVPELGSGRVPVLEFRLGDRSVFLGPETVVSAATSTGQFSLVQQPSRLGIGAALRQWRMFACSP